MGQAKQRGTRDERIAGAVKNPAEKKGGRPDTILVTCLVAGKELAEFDEEITDQFEMRAGSMDDVRSARMQVAIRNSDGEIYRAVGITGMNVFLDMVRHLADIGLVDELAADTSPRGGYDAIFSA